MWEKTHVWAPMGHSAPEFALLPRNHSIVRGPLVLTRVDETRISADLLFELADVQVERVDLPLLAVDDLGELGDDLLEVRVPLFHRGQPQ